MEQLDLDNTVVVYLAWFDELREPLRRVVSACVVDSNTGNAYASDVLLATAEMLADFKSALGIILKRIN